MDERQSRLPVASDNNMSASTAEIEDRFRYGTLAYAEALSIFSVRIESLKQEIQIFEMDLKPLESLYANTEQETQVQQRILENLNDKFCKKAESIIELESEYRSSLGDGEYKKILNHKKRELSEILSEIEQIEDDLLQIELERLHIFEKLEPKRDELSELKRKLNRLELEKAHFESTRVHHIGNIAKESTFNEKQSDDRVVDVDTI